MFLSKVSQKRCLELLSTLVEETFPLVPPAAAPAPAPAAVGLMLAIWVLMATVPLVARDMLA